MKIRIEASTLHGTVAAVPSKSHAHRVLVAAALSDAPCKVICPAVSDDIEATVRCLVALGAKITRTTDGFSVKPVTGARKGVTLDCGESGTTLRFMLPVSCALGADARLVGRGRLPLRPIGGLADTLAAAGVEFSATSLPLSAKGRLAAGEYEVDGSVSSQYISGMLLALGALGGRSTLRTQGKAVSRGYVDMTLSVLDAFGVKVAVSAAGDLFEIQGDGFRSPREIAVEGDWSGAAFPIAAGVLAGDITVTGLNPDSTQRDKKIADAVRLMGGDITVTDDGVRAKKSALRAVATDIDDTPDIAPVLSVLMAAAEGDGVMTGVGRLRDKESDRLAAIISNLAAMGAGATADGDSLTVHGTGGALARNFVAEGFGDHRMVMSAAVAAYAVGGEVTDAEAVAKSYPAFFADMAALGGKTDEPV